MLTFLGVTIGLTEFLTLLAILFGAIAAWVKINGKVVKMEEGLNNLSGKIESLEDKVGEQERNISVTSIQLSGIQTQLSNVSSRLDNIYSHLLSLTKEK